MARGEAPDELIALYEQHHARLVRALSAAGYLDAEDAVQEAFVRAFVHWKKVSRYDDPAAWVRRVAVNRCLNARRGRNRQAKLADRIAQQPQERSPERDDRISERIDALAPQQRTALSLYYLGDCTVRETADAMGISEGAVKYHLHAARDALRGRSMEHDGP